jgi:SAM-dependent methyltransferase
MLNPIIHYYTNDYREADRLFADGAGRLELVRTQELLQRWLPERPARVADVGGATGVYAKWLMELGHEVELVDLTPSHVQAARAGLPGLRAQVGDARSLPLEDADFDVTLVMGPLYHLVSAIDRQQALREAIRVTRPGGVVAVTVISLHASLLDLSVHGLLDDAAVEGLRELMSTGVNDGRWGFTESYLHTAEELEEELVGSGLRNVEVMGVEGPLWPVTRFRDPNEDLGQFVTAARVAEKDQHIIAASAHLLGVGRTARTVSQ